MLLQRPLSTMMLCDAASCLQCDSLHLSRGAPHIFSGISLKGLQWAPILSGIDPFLTAVSLLCICVSEQAAATLEYALLLDIADKEQALEHMKTLVSYFRFFFFYGCVLFRHTNSHVRAHTESDREDAHQCFVFERICGFAG
jgi:hypothetical protein